MAATSNLKVAWDNLSAIKNELRVHIMYIDFKLDMKVLN